MGSFDGVPVSFAVLVLCVVLRHGGIWLVALVEGADRCYVGGWRLRGWTISSALLFGFDRSVFVGVPTPCDADGWDGEVWRQISSGWWSASG